MKAFGHPGYDDDSQYPDDDEDMGCQRCDNTGVILVCIDDICRGLGECIHGDGEIVCPVCKGASGD